LTIEAAVEEVLEMPRVGGRQPSLTPEQELEIVSLYTTTDTPVKEIASTYGVGETTPFRILTKHGVSWRRGDLMPESKPGPKRELPPHIAAMQDVHVAPAPSPEPVAPKAEDKSETITAGVYAEPEEKATVAETYRPISRDELAEVIAAPNGQVPAAEAARIPRWRIEFSGAVELEAVSFDRAVEKARSFGAQDITLVKRLP